MNKFKTFRLLCAALVASALGVGAAEATVSIVAFGDSLSAGYGVGPGESFPEQLEAALRARGHDVTVANAGVSGDTASDGLARLEWSIPPRRTSSSSSSAPTTRCAASTLRVTREALDRDRRQAQGARPGGAARRHAGAAQSRRPLRRGVRRHLPGARRPLRGPALPLLPGGRGRPTTALNQPDGLHPTAAGVAKIVEGILPQVETLVAARAD